MLEVAIEEALQGYSEGGLPIGAVLFHESGALQGRGRNRLVQCSDPSLHAETDAFRSVGRRPHYRDLLMVTTLAPCWYCSGLVRHFRIGTVIVGDSSSFHGGIDWLREHGVKVIELQSGRCRELLANYIKQHPSVWTEASCGAT
jgi:cytosine/creatinine deaminase